MIQIFGADKTAAGLFKDHDALFKHINDFEHTKLTESSCFPRDIWSFVIFTNKRLSYIFHKTLERSFSKVGKEAFEQELDLIEISKGDFQNPLQIPVTPDINIPELKKKWCQEYCDAHDLVMVDYDNPFTQQTGETIPAANYAGGIPENHTQRYARRVHAPL